MEVGVPTKVKVIIAAIHAAIQIRDRVETTECEL